MDHLENFNFKILGNSASNNYLVFLHGLMGSGINWSRIAKKFEADYQILIYDQRGHGRSFKPKKSYHPKDYADDLFKILNELGWDKINLVGHSMGGRNALSFAGLYPDKLNKLVIEDISPSIKESAIESMRSLINSVPVPFSNKVDAQEFLQGEFLDRFDDPVEGKVITQFFAMNLVDDKSTGQTNWRFYKAGILETLESGRKENAWPIVENLQMPTLFIYGENSGELSEDDLLKLDANANIKTCCVKNAGHWVHFDQMDEFTKSLIHFFK